MPSPQDSIDKEQGTRDTTSRATKVGDLATESGSESLGDIHRQAVILSLWEEDEALAIDAVRLRNSLDDIAEELEQSHLPALEAAGFIEWDRQTGEISKGPNFEEAVHYLDSLASTPLHQN